MTSNNNFQNNFHLFINQNHFRCYISMIILLSKSMCLCVGNGFFMSHHRLRKPKHFYDLSPLGTMSDHNWRAFHLREDLSLLANTWHIFSFTLLINHATVLDVVPFNRAYPIKHQTQCRFTKTCTHTHLMRCPRAYTMQDAIACYIMSHT